MHVMVDFVRTRGPRTVLLSTAGAQLAVHKVVEMGDRGTEQRSTAGRAGRVQ